MKRLSLALAWIVITGLLCVVAAGVATTYNDTLSGFQSASSEGIAMVLDAGGDLPGMGRVTLLREGNNVTGGNWTLTIFPPNADATTNR